MLVAEGENGEGDRETNEGTEQPPQEGPEENREQYDQGRDREHFAGYARLDIAADDELDDVEAGEDAQNRLPPVDMRPRLPEPLASCRTASSPAKSETA